MRITIEVDSEDFWRALDIVNDARHEAHKLAVRAQRFAASAWHRGEAVNVYGMGPDTNPVRGTKLSADDYLDARMHADEWMRLDSLYRRLVAANGGMHR